MTDPDKPVVLPALPIAGVTPQATQWLTAMPRSGLFGGLLGALVVAALVLKSLWVSAVALALIVWLARGSTRTQGLVERSPLLPAQLEGQYAYVLVSCTVVSEGWQVCAKRLRMTSRHQLLDDERALGYIVREVYSMRFLPLAPLLTSGQRALANPERMAPGYFALLSALRSEGQFQGDLLTAVMEAERVAVLFAPPEAVRAALQPSAAGVQLLEPTALGEPARFVRWCAGLPELGNSSLTTDERAYLQRQRRGLLRSALLHAVHAAIGLASLAAVGCIGLGFVDFSLIPYALSGVMILALRVASAGIATRRLRRARAVTADLASRGCAVFRGAAGQLSTHHDSGQRRLVDQGLVLPDASKTHELRVAERSQLLVGVDGRTPASAVTLHISAIAGAPDALDVSLPPGSGIVLAPGYRARRRWLSGPERQELEAHIKRARPVRIAGVLYFAALPGAYAWIGARLALWAVLGHVVLAGLLIVQSYRRYRWQTRLEAELELGWLLVVASETDPKARRAELLAQCGAPWTLDGAPAPWRTQRPV